MNAEDAVLEIKSIEELTLHSLDRSLEGLEILRRDSLRCGETFLSNPNDGMLRLVELAKNLKDFYVFENDICSLFQIDQERIRDNRGDLKAIEAGLSLVMEDIPARLDKQDYSAVADLSRIDLPGLLDRFQDLLPALRNYIESEYMVSAS